MSPVCSFKISFNRTELELFKSLLEIIMAGRGKDDNCLKVLVAVIITSSKLSIFLNRL